MKLRWWHLCLAFVLSLAIHAAADFLVRQPEAVVREQGIPEAQFAFIGSELDNMVMAGDEVTPAVVNAVLSQVAPANTVRHLQSRSVETIKSTDAVEGMRAGVAIAPAVTEMPIVTVAAVDLARLQAPMESEPLEKPSKTPVKPVAERTAAVRPVGAPASPIENSQAPEAIAAFAEPRQQTETPEKQAPGEHNQATVSQIVHVPVPTPSPRRQTQVINSRAPDNPVKANLPVVQQVEKTKPLEAGKTAALIRPADVAKKKVRQKAKAKTKGNKGNASKSARKGSASGKQKGATASTGKGGSKKKGTAGNASIANYPGKVRRKLRRAVRYPKKARGGKARGTTVVRFSVKRNGRVTGARVVRGSGSPALDSAAMAAVRRAAPFPSIPSGVKRASWTFTVPVEFVRR